MLTVPLTILRLSRCKQSSCKINCRFKYLFSMFGILHKNHPEIKKCVPKDALKMYLSFAATQKLTIQQADIVNERIHFLQSILCSLNNINFCVAQLFYHIYFIYSIKSFLYNYKNIEVVRSDVKWIASPTSREESSRCVGDAAPCKTCHC